MVPAVVVLDEVRSRIQALRPDLVMTTIAHAKFQNVVLPNRPFRIDLAFGHLIVGEETDVDFVCIDVEDERPLASGRLRFAVVAKRP